MVLLACETDFVSKNPEFVALAKDIAMQVAATAPAFIARTEVSDEIIQKAKEVFAPEVEGKPEEMKEKIMEGKLTAYFKDQVLLEQSFIKNPDLTISEMVNGAVQKFGENISIVKISRVSVK
jgi:elongation factor Ts